MTEKTYHCVGGVETTETPTPLMIEQQRYRMEILPQQMIFGRVQTTPPEHTNTTTAKFNFGPSSSYSRNDYRYFVLI